MPNAGGIQTRTRILDAAQALILENGFAGTSIEQLVGQAGITKGTFFYHFTNKEDLARQLVERYSQADLDLLAANMARAERLSREPLQQLLIFVGLYQEIADALTAPYPGCLLASYMSESGQFTPETLDVIARTMLTWREQLTAKLREVVAVHPPRIEVHLESLADMVTVVFEGAFVVSRTLKDPRTFSRQLHHLRTYLELLFAERAHRGGPLTE